MIIALSGKKESGKDTVADFIISHYEFKKYSFAEPMKRMAMLLFDWTWEQCNDKILKEQIDLAFGFSPRQFLQWIGTDIFQYEICKRFPLFETLIGRHFWVDKFVKFYHKNGGVTSNFVISDLRFPHEVKTILSLEKEVFVARIIRPDENPSDSTDRHESEKAIESIKFDFLIDNSKDFDHLYRLVEDMMWRINDNY